MRDFARVLVAALLSSALGGGFGWGVGELSPEFVRAVARPQTVATLAEFAPRPGWWLARV